MGKHKQVNRTKQGYETQWCAAPGEWDTIVSIFNSFFISLVEELTMHFKCPDIPLNPVDKSKPVFSIGDISVS